MGYLDELMGTNKNPVSVAAPVKAPAISSVGTLDKMASAPKPQTSGGGGIPAVQKPKADTLGLQSANVPTEVFQPASVGKELSQPVSKLESSFSPTVTGAWGVPTAPDVYKNYEAMSPLEKAMYAQKFSQTATSDLMFGPNSDRSFAQKVGGFALDMSDAFTRDIANIRLTNRLSEEVAAGRVDKSVFDGIEVLNKSAVQIFGDTAQFVLNAYTPNVGIGLIKNSMGKQVLTQGLKELGKQGFKEGSFAGFQYGIAQAMRSGSSDPKEIAQIITANTVGGGVLGASFSTAIPAVSKVVAGVKRMQSEFVDDLVRKGYSPAEAQKLSKEGGFFGTFNPKIKNMEAEWQRLQEAKLKAPSKQAEARLVKAQKAIEKEIRREEQGGFVKNPFVKETQESTTKLEIPKIKDKNGWFDSLRKTLNPINYADDTTKQAYNNYSRSLVASHEATNTIAKSFDDIPSKVGWEAVLDYEHAVPNQYSGRIQQTFDDLHKEALSQGLDVPYRQNYVPQIYKNTQEEIKLAVGNFLMDQGVSHETVQAYVNELAELPTDIATRLKMTPNFAKARVLPNYQTAMQYGLKPKYTHPGQLAGAYKQELEKAVAGRKLIGDLVSSGKLVPARGAPSNYEAVTLAFSPKGYYAEPTLAKVLNGQFRNEIPNFGQKLAAGAASLSKKAQEITLSGGVPNTDINFFALGQVIKNLTAGDVKAIPAFVRANFDDASIKWFEKKAPMIKTMAQHGIDLSSRVGKMAEMYDNMVASPTIREAFGKGWERTFERKTFASFIPQIQIQTFESAFKKAVANGIPEMEAGELAAKVTRAFYGMFEDTGRSKTAQDTLSALFFAPKFREGIIRTLWNTGKSVTTERTNPVYYMNRRLAMGMAISYGIYNLANKAMNGQYMWENEKGREFALRIPAGDKVLYIEFMPSFLSLPRNILSGTKALVTGDLKTATQKGSSLLSQPVQLGTQLVTNKDYFGNPIYNENDSGVDKFKDVGAQVLPSITHPYMRAAKDLLAPNEEFKKPLIQTIMEASELPVKVASMDQISRNKFYEALDDKAKDNKADKKKLQPIYDQVQKLKKEGKREEAQQLVDNLSDEEWETYKKIRSADKTSATVAAEAKIFTTYEKVEELKKQGKKEEAQAIVDALSEEEWAAFKKVRDRLK